MFPLVAVVPNGTQVSTEDRGAGQICVDGEGLARQREGGGWSYGEQREPRKEMGSVERKGRQS